MSVTMEDLRERRRRAHARLLELISRADEGKRGLTEAEQSEYDFLMSLIFLYDCRLKDMLREEGERVRFRFLTVQEMMAQ